MSNFANQVPIVTENEVASLTTPKERCDPWREPLKCPLLLFTILVIIGLIFNIWNIARTPAVNNAGQPISNAQKWTVGIIGILIYLIIAYLFGWWMYNLCAKCEALNSWLVFLLAIFFPIILALILSIIFGIILGITTFATNF